LNTDFRQKAVVGVGVAGVLLLSPFSLNHLRQGRVLLGLGTLLIVTILGSMAWLGSRDRYHPWIVLLGFAPAVLVFIDFSVRDQGVIGALWCFPAILAFYFMLPEPMAWIANGALYAVAVPETWRFLEPSVSARVSATLLGVSVFSAIFVRVIDTQQRELEAQAVTDSLTGLHNRALLSSTLEQGMEQSRRSGTPMTLLALDLDDFKGINDTLGHDAGDAVLRGVAHVLQSRIRRSDRAFRMGGEEFLAFLYGTDQLHGRQVAEDLRAAIQSASLLPGRPVTVSIGVAAFCDDPSWEAWVKRCDMNLYGAKTSGRNRVVG